MSLDTRAWNIVAGLCVATGCGGRTISIDGGNETASETNTDISTSAEQTGPECETAADCPYGYYCYDGVCEYVPHHDGHLDYTDDYWYAECYSDADCGSFSLCNFDYCESVWTPQTCLAPDMPVAVPIPDVALALSFVDADADGAEELVVATELDIHVFESGLDMPSSSLREVASGWIDGMVGGNFDANAGEDLLIMFNDELYSYASAGDGSFAAPSMQPTGWPVSLHVAAGDFNGQAPDDLLIWGETGAVVQFSGGSTAVLSDLAVHAASARSLTDPIAGYVIQNASTLGFFELTGLDLATAEVRGIEPVALASIAELGDGFDVSASRLGAWTLLQEWGPATANTGAQWGVLDHVTQMIGGDFNADARADLALIISDRVYIQFGVHEQGCLSEFPLNGVAREIAVGDHDGDGDDELAVRVSTGEVWVIDAG